MSDCGHSDCSGGWLAVPVRGPSGIDVHLHACTECASAGQQSRFAKGDMLAGVWHSAGDERYYLFAAKLETPATYWVCQGPSDVGLAGEARLEATTVVVNWTGETPSEERFAIEFDEGLWLRPEGDDERPWLRRRSWQPLPLLESD